MRVIAALVLLAVGCGGTDPGDGQRRWTGEINTSRGDHYTASLFIGGEWDAGYYSAEAPGLSGAVVGPLPSATVLDRCDAGFPIAIVLHGDAADVSYTNATCADAGSGSGTLWRY